MQLLRNDVNKLLKKAKLDVSLLEKPPRSEMGDLAFPCFGLAKNKKKNIATYVPMATVLVTAIMI